MKERPILFSAPMVRAILDGRKTQTRRIVDRLTDFRFVTAFERSKTPGFDFSFRDSHLRWHDMKAEEVLGRCPFGQPGDRLWVREAWRIGAWDETRPAFALDYCDGARKEWIEVPDAMGDDGELFDRLWQQSSDDAAKALGIQDRYQWEPGQSPCRWRPSIHMPRWASRILLEVVRVRVERLQAINEVDAIAEGADPVIGDHQPYRAGFMRLWKSINGPGSWDANPWVWVIEFRRIKP